MKQFVVTIHALERHHETPISEESFQAAKNAFKILNEVILLEERFDAVAGGFLDFEKAMLAKMLDFSYSGFKDGLHQMSVRRDLNRLMMNALSAARGYIDHLPHTCSCVFGKEDERTNECSESLEQSYDQFLGYRIFEALRNHSQHFGFPIQLVSYSHQGEGDAPYSRTRLTISPIADTEVLEQNKKFKKSVLFEMKSLGTQIDLKPYFREYMRGIAKAHYRFRELVSPIANGAHIQLSTLSEQYTSSGGGSDHIALYAIAKVDDHFVESLPLSTGMHQYSEYLSVNNVHFDQPGDFYIASAGRDEKLK